MKCYVLVHSHLSSIQKGIQAAHAVAELMWKTGDDTRLWFLDVKTIVMLEGGNTDSLTSLADSMIKTNFDYAIFNEDEATLGKLTTAIAVIVDMNRLHNYMERNLLVKIDEAWLAS